MVLGFLFVNMRRRPEILVVQLLLATLFEPLFLPSTYQEGEAKEACEDDNGSGDSDASLRTAAQARVVRDRRWYYGWSGIGSIWSEWTEE